jgi:hypothetical protein
MTFRWLVHYGVDRVLAFTKWGRGPRIDRAGQVVAALCVVHCLFVPLTIAVLPVIGLELIADRRVERALVVLAIAIGSIALIPALLRTHRRVLPLAAFACGAALLLIAQFLAQSGSGIERALTLAGAVTIAAAHSVNIRFCTHAHGR